MSEEGTSPILCTAAFLHPLPLITNHLKPVAHVNYIVMQVDFESLF